MNLVILAYRRVEPLQRLLLSLERSHTPCTVNLFVSCDGGASQHVQELLNRFTWSGGHYEVVFQEKNRGVDQHNIHALRWAIEKGHAVILEDDLTVSPFYAYYLMQALECVEDSKGIAGISLYRYPRVDSTHFPFELIPNSEDVYYMQRPSSKGCLYTAEMAQSFLSYLDGRSLDFKSYHLPPNVLRWGDEVWEKAFYCYLQDTGRFLLFPRYSYSTDHGDQGVHMAKEVEQYKHHSSLYLSADVRIKPLQKTANVYDAFYEILPEQLSQFGLDLDVDNLEMDLYGTKDLKKIAKTHLISERLCIGEKKGWGRTLKPEINNLLLDQKGDFYSYAEKHAFKDKEPKDRIKENFMYYYPDTKITDLLKMKWSELRSRR